MWCTLCCPKEQTQYNNESIQDNEKQIIIGNTKLNHVTIETCIQFIKFCLSVVKIICCNRPHRIDCTEIYLQFIIFVIIFSFEIYDSVAISANEICLICPNSHKYNQSNAVQILYCRINCDISI